MRLYVGEDAPKVPRRELNPVLRGGTWDVVDDPAEADCLMLPMLWDPSAADDLARLCRTASDIGKEVVVFAGGDFEPLLPFSNIILFHPGPIRGAVRPHQVAASPYFSDDLLTRYSGPLKIRDKQERPSVGFCGQAAVRPAARVGYPTRNAIWHLRQRLGRLPFAAPPVRGHMHLRRRALRVLQESPLVEDHFIIRARYRAGINGPERRGHATTLEFVHNIEDTDYTLCVRGSGNFSARFYEALCLGRIPVLVDTDSLLPAEELIEWEKYIVRVPSTDIDSLASHITRFHNALSEKAFRTLQQDCRRLWEQWFVEQSYASKFLEIFRSEFEGRGAHHT